MPRKILTTHLTGPKLDPTRFLPSLGHRFGWWLFKKPWCLFAGKSTTRIIIYFRSLWNRLRNALLPERSRTLLRFLGVISGLVFRTGHLARKLYERAILLGIYFCETQAHSKNDFGNCASCPGIEETFQSNKEGFEKLVQAVSPEAGRVVVINRLRSAEKHVGLSIPVAWRALLRGN